MDYDHNSILRTYISTLRAQNKLKATQKKIYLFGEWSIISSLLDELQEVLEIEKILDNEYSHHGKFIRGKEVVSPNHLKNEKKGEFAVFILCNYVEEISKQLEDMGLSAEIDYFDLYTSLECYPRVKMFENSILSLKEFINRIPEQYFRNIPITQKENIGIVCICEMNRYLTAYSIVLGLLLRSCGYKVTLIIDALKAFESHHYFEGIEAIAKEYVDKVLPTIKSKCPDIEITYIDQEGRANLDTKDKIQVNKMARYVLKWFNARYNQGLFKDYENPEQQAEAILSDTLSYIKKFFQMHKFNVISVYTGLHRHRCMYYYCGKIYFTRVCTSDAGELENMIYCTSGIAAHNEDIAKMFNREYFNDKEESIIVKWAEDYFRKRVSDTFRAEKDLCYDIVIPLNIAWDAAALDRDDIFHSELEWLNETLLYILQYTDANVIIREHPLQNDYKYYYHDNLKKELPIIEENNDRIYFAGASDRVNIYQLVKHCKLVLPYTSTVGLEAAMMEKNVILHTKVYYENLGIAYKATDKDDYFNTISYYLEHPDEIICKNKKNAFLGYYYLLNNGIESEFCIHHAEWLKYSLEELKQLPGVAEVIEVVGTSTPSIYSVIRNKLGN